MNKGIIMVNIPDCCAYCLFAEAAEDPKDKVCCGATLLYINDDELYSKPDWCPITPIPEMKDEENKLCIVCTRLE